MCHGVNHTDKSNAKRELDAILGFLTVQQS